MGTPHWLSVVRLTIDEKMVGLAVDGKVVGVTIDGKVRNEKSSKTLMKSEHEKKHKC